MTIRVAVVDDQALVRRGFTLVLDHQDDIAVVAEAGDGVEAIDVTMQHRPDVVLMDIRMPELDGLAATSRIIERADWPVKVIILTTFDPDEYVYRALEAGASGFILKDIPPENLAPAIRTVADGGALLDPTITRRLIGRFAESLATDLATTRRLEVLTDREREVLGQLGADAAAGPRGIDPHAGIRSVGAGDSLRAQRAGVWRGRQRHGGCPCGGGGAGPVVFL